MRVRFLVALLVVMAAAGAAVLVARDSESLPLARSHGSAEVPTTAEVAVRACPSRHTSWGPGHWPRACWRPYSDRSPFNRPISAHPRVARNSRGIVRRLEGFGALQNLLAGQGDQAYGRPTYWSKRSDPVFRLHCTRPWGRCAIEGRRIRIPDAAQAAAGPDGHMTVVDQRSGWEYDLWHVERKPPGGGRLDFAWGGRTRLRGSGLGSAATASGFGNLAGEIRAEELAAGHIGHALFLTVACDSGRSVYPARKGGRRCSEIGASNGDAPPMGARFQLAMSDRQIDALGAPGWQRAILRAMAHYGMYVGDTGGSWALDQENGRTYTSFGYPDKWVTFAQRIGAPFYAPDGNWTLSVRSGVDWGRYLRVLEPCSARGRC